VDGPFLDAASDGRMDMLAAFASLLRDRLVLTLSGNSACAGDPAIRDVRKRGVSDASRGGVGFAGLLMLYLYFDRRGLSGGTRRWRRSHC